MSMPGIVPWAGVAMQITFVEPGAMAPVVVTIRRRPSGTVVVVARERRDARRNATSQSHQSLAARSRTCGSGSASRRA